MTSQIDRNRPLDHANNFESERGFYPTLKYAEHLLQVEEKGGKKLVIICGHSRGG
jgi:hypothetical protein